MTFPNVQNEPCAFSTDILSAHSCLQKKKKKCTELQSSYFHCRCLNAHFPVFHMPQPYVSGWACVQCRDGADQFRITFRTVSATDMIWCSRYSQQLSTGRTVDTVLPSFVIPSFRGSPTRSQKIHTHTHTQSVISRCSENNSFPCIQIGQKTCIFLSSLVVNRLQLEQPLTPAIMWKFLIR